MSACPFRLFMVPGAWGPVDVFCVCPTSSPEFECCHHALSFVLVSGACGHCPFRCREQRVARRFGARPCVYCTCKHPHCVVVFYLRDSEVVSQAKMSILCFRNGIGTPVFKIRLSPVRERRRCAPRMIDYC